MYTSDVIKTSGGDLKITFIGHGSLMFTFGDSVIHVDPTSEFGDYSKLPKADLILITHQHLDHFDQELVKVIRKGDALIIGNEAVAEQMMNCVVMKNGDVKTFYGLIVEAVPAYNIKHMRSPGIPFHPYGEGNGYVITFEDKRVYVAGDTENIPEMRDLKDIDICFLPMNLPYTMTPEMIVDAIKMFSPRVVYTYNFCGTDTSKLETLWADSDVELRIRDLQ